MQSPVRSSRFRFAVLPVGAMLLWSCGQVDYHPVPPASAVLTVNHMGAYSSQLGDDREIPGTMFQTQWTWIWKKQGDGYLVQRRLDTLNGRGYHKNSMPNELEKKVNLDMWLGSNGVPYRITGYDSLYAVLRRIPQRESYREELLRMSDTARFQAERRDVFRLRRLLPQGPLPLQMPIPVDSINKSLETLTLDSARYQGPRPRLKLSCLEYDTYYHRSDSLPLLVEQFFYSASKNRAWKHATWKPGRVDGIRHFSLERSTGLPCFESISETGHIVLHDTTQNEDQPITLYRYEEDIFSR